jgi:hypothetical protein
MQPKRRLAMFCQVMLAWKLILGTSVASCSNRKNQQRRIAAQFQLGQQQQQQQSKSLSRLVVHVVVFLLESDDNLALDASL